MRILTTLATFLFTALAPFALAHGNKAGAIEINHPYTKAMNPGAKVGGGFMVLTNTGHDADRLVSASSPRAAMVQIHEMKMEGDVMKMAELKDGIALAPGETVELKPGGLHIMFMNVDQPFKEGETIKATLTFEKAGTVEVDFTVGPAQGQDNGHDAHAHHKASTDAPQSDDPLVAIPGVMKALFETEGNPLTVEPVIVSGDWAVAGWSQAGKGGRALLKKGHHGWAIHMCSGASLKDAATLTQIGISDEDATTLAQRLGEAEAALGAERIALHDSFEGTMMLDH